MKIATLAAAAVMALAIPAAASAQQAPAPSSAPTRSATEEANARTVVAFYEMAFNQHKPTEAARIYIGDHYIQHNPLVPNGAEPFYSYFEGFFRENPQSRATIHRVIADGDLVALHVHSQDNQQDRGRAIIDIFRLENGKIVEHFDVIQDVPAATTNGNTMFDGSKRD
ncbi:MULTISPECIES: nuclear transport factor 2 family protein [unclassified Brevundimonas]|uniref:nuclear transport factor 2 family protein n=1 Tax=unclassified Brevundimonas TaxID=2622653 RepID=UPI0025C3FD30|nr:MULTISPECIES: nuclear transport factor 2 family protein [unclassified Brevundimonas]